MRSRSANACRHTIHCSLVRQIDPVALQLRTYILLSHTVRRSACPFSMEYPSAKPVQYTTPYRLPSQTFKAHEKFRSQRDIGSLRNSHFPYRTVFCRAKPANVRLECLSKVAPIAKMKSPRIDPNHSTRKSSSKAHRVHEQPA